MGLFSNVFKSSVNNSISNAKSVANNAKNGLNRFKNGFSGKGRTAFFSRTTAKNRATAKRGGYSGGWAAIAFGNIINAHSSADEIVEEFSLDKEDNSYNCDAYERAYLEQYSIAEQIYEDYLDYYQGLIDQLTNEHNSLIAEAEELEEEAQELMDEAEGLINDAELEIDPEWAAEYYDEAQELLNEAQELIDQAKLLREEAEELSEQIEQYVAEAEALTIEQFIDEDVVNANAFTYACEFAEQWINGEIWIPSDVLDWAFYEVSDHNG